MQLDLPIAQIGASPSTDALTPHYDPIHVSSSTFLAGLSANVHRWFRLTPSFAPDLVRYALERFEAPTTSLIYDPFSGAGTTAIECALEGYDSICTEINPLLHFVNRVSLDWSLSANDLDHALKHITEHYRTKEHALILNDVEANGFNIPPIHNWHRWWRPDVLSRILLLKSGIHALPDKAVRDFFRLSLAGVLVPDLTNVTLGRLQLHFINRDNDEIDVLSLFTAHSQKMIDDFRALDALERYGHATVLNADAVSLSGVKPSRPIDCVITSPPYPNRYSYVWNTRPHLYMLDLISVAREASEIDRATIGGTWGTATSELQKGDFPPVNAAVEEAVGPVASKIREQDNLMANYLMHYFNRLTSHLVNLHPLLGDNAKLAYVVGNSWLKGVYVETDVLLGRVFDLLDEDYRTTEIQRFRRRHSGKELYESIVFATAKS